MACLCLGYPRHRVSGRCRWSHHSNAILESADSIRPPVDAVDRRRCRADRLVSNEPGTTPGRAVRPQAGCPGYRAVQILASVVRRHSSRLQRPASGWVAGLPPVAIQGVFNVARLADAPQKFGNAESLGRGREILAATPTSWQKCKENNFLKNIRRGASAA